MKKIVIALLAMLIMAAAVSYTAAEEVPAETGDPEIAEWTVMFYLCGSDLESKYGFASGTLQEISEVDYPDYMAFMYANTLEESRLLVQERKPADKVNVLIETGGSRRWHAGDEYTPDKIQRWQYDCISFYDDPTGEQNQIRLLESLPKAPAWPILKR